MATMVATSTPSSLSVYAPMSMSAPTSRPSQPLLPSASPVTTPYRAQGGLRPAKNIEAFNSLLPPPVEFVEGSSRGALAVPEGKYEPINASPRANGISEPKTKLKPAPSMHARKDSIDSQEQASPLYNRHIDLTWPPEGYGASAGLFNLGNTCFLNSALQCLLHTPPLLRVLLDHSKVDPCRVKNTFCMSCAMKDVALRSFRQGRAFTPSAITGNLNRIAKHLRKGRQEDSHEFLRYAIDAFQKACLAGYPPKLDPKIAETTWVHKIFGGRLRSRVSCTQCGHNSDTFDSILDLSIDIHNVSGLNEAFKKFTAVDHLKGVDKYKCDKCKRPVNAEKRFTIHDAPAVLTVHLKRFTPLGRKLSNGIVYNERLDISPVMSKGQYGPTYSLYGVICHAGSGPNSGHYYAFVKSSSGRWLEMNDDSVQKMNGPPTNHKNAYILFYMRDKGQALEAALNNSNNSSSQLNGLHVNGTTKRRRIVNSDDEDKGEKASPNFIGPAIPPHLQRLNGVNKLNGGDVAKASARDPQADMLKRKIEAAERSREKNTRANPALMSLALYGDDAEEGEDDEKGEAVGRLTASSSLTQVNDTSSPPPPSSPVQTASPSPIDTVPSSSFYGTSFSSSSTLRVAGKRKSPDGDYADSENALRASGNEVQRLTNVMNGGSFKTPVVPRPSFGSGNPYGGRMKDSINSSRDESALSLKPRRLQKNHYGGNRKQRSII